MVTLESGAKVFARLHTKTCQPASQPAGGFGDVGVNMHAGLRETHAFICIVWECKFMCVIPMFIMSASGLRSDVM